MALRTAHILGAAALATVFTAAAPGKEIASIYYQIKRVSIVFFQYTKIFPMMKQHKKITMADRLRMDV